MSIEALQFGPYRVLAPLGRGSMGVVYRARHTESGREVALKTVRVPYGSAVAGLRCEIYALTRIAHPGIVRIVEEGIAGDQPWYAMELLEGPTLESYIRALWGRSTTAPSEALVTRAPTRLTLDLGRGGSAHGSSGRGDSGSDAVGEALDSRGEPCANGRLSEALEMARSLCGPLAFLHGVGVVHRDLKPSNVILRDGRAPVLVDFGLVQRVGAAIGREVIEVAGDIIGTAAYMPPEQIRGELVDARSDLYSLGCILYELVTGSIPFVAEQPLQVLFLHLHNEPQRPSERVRGVPPALDALILRLLAKEPRDRLGYADDVAEALREILGAAPALDSPHGAYLYRPGMAGRKGHLAAFKAHVTRAREGRGRCVLMGGESGVGKTFLASVIAREATLKGFRVVTGECVAVASSGSALGGEVRAAPLHPFRRLFEALADRCREEGAPATHRLLGPRAKVLAEYDASLRELPGADAYPDPPAVPAEAARRRLLVALSEALASLADEGPLLLILDDLQWADELTLSLLASLERSFFESRALLVLGTYRTEEVGDALRELLAHDAHERLELERLDPAAIGVIIGDMLGMRSPPEALVSVLARSSAGNPFFCAEYLRTAVAERLLYREFGQWRLDQSNSTTLEGLALPTSLRDLVQRRLDGLAAGAQRLAAAASVLGREVDGDVLVEASGVGRDEALQGARELLSRQVLEEVTPGRFRFVHDKLREFAYERIPEAARRALHRAAARALEARFSGAELDARLMWSELAYHYSEAGDLARAVDNLEKAGEQAERTFANREAVRALSEALNLDDRSGRRASKLRRATWERQLGSALLGLGRLVESQEHLGRAVALLGAPMPLAAHRLFARFGAEVLTQLRHRLSPSGGLEEIPDDERRALREAARAYDLLVPVTYYVTGEVPRVLFATLANLNLAERSGPSPELARAYANAHLTAGLIPAFALAGMYGRKAHETLEGVSDPAVRSWVYVLAGAYAAGIGSWGTAFNLGAQALKMAEAIGFRRRIEEAQGVLGTAHCLHGDFEQARDISQRTFDSGLRGDPQTQVWGAAGVAQACLPLGQVERALASAQRAERCLSEKLGRPEKIIAHGVLALAWLRSGEPRRAREAAERGIEAICEGAPISFYCIVAYNCVAEVFLDLWEAASGAERAPLMRQIRRACAEVERSARIFPAQRPRSLWIRGRLCSLLGDAAQARRLWREAAEDASRRDLGFDEALAHASLAAQCAPDAPERAERLARARELFARRGAEHHLRALGPSTGASGPRAR